MRHIEFADISPLLRDAVEPLVRQWESILPSWVEKLKVREGAGGADANVLAEMNVAPEYRAATIFIYPLFMAHEDKVGVIIHEFCHAYTTPIGMIGRQYIEDAKMPESEAATLRRRITDYEEMSTCDLVTLVGRLNEAAKLAFCRPVTVEES